MILICCKCVRDLVSLHPSLLFSVTHPVQLDGVDPLQPVLGVLCSQVPNAVVHTDVQPAFVKLVRLKENKHRTTGRVSQRRLGNKTIESR